MALAIYQYLLDHGIKSRIFVRYQGFIHAMIEVGGVLHDHQGGVYPSRGKRSYTNSR